MKNAYTLSNGRLSKIHLDAQDDLRLNHPIGLTLLRPLTRTVNG